MSQPKVLLLCGSTLALPAIQELAFFQQLAALIIPERCHDFIENVDAVFKGMNIPVEIVNKGNQEEILLNAFEKYEANVGLMITYSFKLPSAVIRKPSFGFYNLHPGPLPTYRGPDPIFQQIKNREKKVTVSLHKVDGDFDSGAVILQESIPLQIQDTYSMVTSNLAQVAMNSIRTLLKLISFDLNVPSKVQDEKAARYFKRQTTNDVIINWDSMDAPAIIAMINACNPWNKGAVTKYNGRIFRLLEAAIFDQNLISEDLPGMIVSINDEGLFVKTLKDQLLIVKIIFSAEGFLHASRSCDAGLARGVKFQSG